MNADPTITGRRYGGASALVRDERRKRQLLDAGLALFGTVGYGASTVRGLCRQARVADRYFYQHFDSTEDLLLAVYLECMDGLTESVVTAMDDAIDATRDGHGSADITVVARRALVAFFTAAQDPQFARVVWIEVLGAGEAMNAAWRGAMDTFATILRERMRSVVPSAADPDSPAARILSTAAVGGLSHVAVTWCIGGYREDLDTMVDAGVRFIVGVGAVA